MSTLALMAYSLGSARIQPGEGAGAGLLRAPGHAARRCASASSRWASTSGSISRSCCRSRSRTTARVCTRCSRSTTASAPGTTRRMLYRGLRRQGVLQALRPAGGACSCRSCERDGPDGRVPVVARRRHAALDRDGCAGSGSQWMSLLVVGGGGIYFGTLWLLGLRPADLRVRSLAGYGRDERWNWSAVFKTCGRVIAAAWRRSATTTACTAVTSTCSPRCDAGAPSSGCPRRWSPSSRHRASISKARAAPARLTRLREKLRGARPIRRRSRACAAFRRGARGDQRAQLRGGPARRAARRAAHGRRPRFSLFAAAAKAPSQPARRRADGSASRVEEVPPFEIEGERVSSSLVRAALEAGDLAVATQLLGRPYRMSGRVQRGQQLGRKLGFPTANLALHRKVDAALGHLRGARRSVPGFTSHPAVASLGTRPTVDGTDPAARGAPVRFRRRPLRPQPRRRFRRAACATKCDSNRSRRWSSRCIGTRRRRARSLLTEASLFRLLRFAKLADPASSVRSDDRLQDDHQPARDRLSR